MKKKAQGLSLNTIIIAAIVLIVLVVLWAIFTGRMGGFATGVKETTGKTCSSVCQSLGEVKTDKTTGTGVHLVGKYDNANCYCEPKATTPKEE